jgi:hypothetical protein
MNTEETKSTSSKRQNSLSSKIQFPLQDSDLDALIEEVAKRKDLTWSIKPKLLSDMEARSIDQCLYQNLVRYLKTSSGFEYTSETNASIPDETGRAVEPYLPSVVEDIVCGYVGNEGETLKPYTDAKRRVVIKLKAGIVETFKGFRDGGASEKLEEKMKQVDDILRGYPGGHLPTWERAASDVADYKYQHPYFPSDTSALERIITRYKSG